MNLTKYLFLKRVKLTPPQILVSGFALVILIGAILLDLPISSREGERIGFLNAFFTATSAVCVTGLVAVDTGTYWSLFGRFVIILLVQIGGLGFMSITTLGALITGKRISLRERLLIQESLNQADLSGIVKLTKKILIGTFLIEILGALILSTVFIPQYGLVEGIGFSVFHSVSAFCNAGFDLIGGFQSLTGYQNNPVVLLTILSLIILGGLGFAVIFDVLRQRSFQKLSLHSKLVLTVTGSLVVLPTFLFYFIERHNPGTLGPLQESSKWLGALFASVSPRTAGFNSVDLAALKDSSKLVTILLMFVGGSPASTAGGIKTTTFIILLLTVRSLIKGKSDVEVFSRRISYESVKKALTVTVVGILLLIGGTMILSLTEQGISFMSLLFEVASALGTVGLSINVSPSLTTLGKIVITLLMFAGRVGAVTILFAVANRKKKAMFRYPEGKIIIG